MCVAKFGINNNNANGVSYIILFEKRVYENVSDAQSSAIINSTFGVRPNSFHSTLSERYKTALPAIIITVILWSS